MCPNDIVDGIRLVGHFKQGAETDHQRRTRLLHCSPQAAPMFTSILEAALQLVLNCPCKEVTGCPECIHFSCCDEYNAVLNKQAGIIVLSCTLEDEKSKIA
jgi:ATP-dependent helicase YprA (DUF1998 family)